MVGDTSLVSSLSSVRCVRRRDLNFDGATSSLDSRAVTLPTTDLTMPPRLPLAQAARCCVASIEAPARPKSLVSLFAALSVQTRSASILASISDNKGAYNKRIRKGRGPSSGYGKTSGRGHKGTGQRGKLNPWFQGGQTALIFSHGKMGFVNQYVLLAGFGLFPPL